jgi:hypothetical protein
MSHAPRPERRPVFAGDDAGTLAPAVAEDPPLVYVPHNRSGDVWEIDPATYQVVAAVWARRGPRGGAVAYRAGRKKRGITTAIGCVAARMAGRVPPALRDCILTMGEHEFA